MNDLDMEKFMDAPASKQSLSNRKLVRGVGINDATYSVRTKFKGIYVTCPYYRKWHNMIDRCYSAEFHKRQPTYIGCTVSKDWLTFSNFKDWMHKQDWLGKHLDKDILTHSNKVYSSETCLFISADLNNLMLDNPKTRGEFPLGVSYDKLNGKFKAQIRKYGKNNYIGLFDSKDDAEKAYLTAKRDYMAEVITKEDIPHSVIECILKSKGLYKSEG